MQTRWTGIASLSAILMVAVAVGGLRAADEQKKPSADDIKKATELVDKQMADLKAAGGMIAVFTDEPLLKVFPSQLFVGVRFRQGPVARRVPEGLNPFNLFVVKDGKVEHVKDGLEKYFKASLPAVKDDALAKEVVRAYLRLAQELKNDGFYQFKLMDDSTKVMTEKIGRKTTGLVMAAEGGNGNITVVLDFDAAGALTNVAEGGKLRLSLRTVRCCWRGMRKVRGYGMWPRAGKYARGRAGALTSRRSCRPTAERWPGLERGVVSRSWRLSSAPENTVRHTWLAMLINIGKPRCSCRRLSAMTMWAARSA
jgi:hypothetical protein